MPSPDPPAPAVPAGLRYHQLQRIGRSGWAWSVLGVLLVGAGVYLLALLGVAPLVASAARLLDAEVDTDPLTPAGLVLVNLVWALAIPVVLLVALLLHRMPGGWLASVVGRLRWRWLGTCLGLSLVALVATVAVTLVLPEQGGSALEPAVNDVTRRTGAFALAVLLLTPLQAAGEEYAFRGYLTQVCGGLVRGPGPWPAVVAVVVPAALFALAHGAQDPPIFVDRLAFGLVAGALVILTGGLEAGIAMHVLNNFLAFGLALAFGDIEDALTPEGGTWWSLPVTLTQSLAYLGLVLWAARRSGLATVTGGGVLEPPRGRV